jgi:hypothetical protein
MHAPCVNDSCSCALQGAKERAELGVRKELESEGPTRFATHLRMVESLEQNKEALRVAVARPTWPRTATAQATRDLVSSDIFWDNNTYAARVWGPIADAQQQLGSDHANMADEYVVYKSITEHLKSFDGDIQQKWRERRAYADHAGLALAAMVDPRHRFKDMPQEERWVP